MTAVLLGVLLYRAWLFLNSSVRAVTFKYGLDYGEGVVWQQARMLVNGQGYTSISAEPFIVFHYPPLYHLAAAGVGRLGLDGLLAGRIVSLLATLVACALTGALVATAIQGVHRRAAFVGVFVASILPLSYLPVLQWAPLMRVDMLAIALGLAGVYCGIRAFTSARWIYAAAALFVGAVYTKQTSIMAPAATFAVLALVQPAVARRGLLACLGLGGIILGALMWSSGGEFARHVFLYNINRYDASRLVAVPLIALGHGLYLLATAALYREAFEHWRRAANGRQWCAPLRDRLQTSARVRVLAVVGLYLVFVSPTLLFIGKIGANVNYLIEWMYLWAIPAGVLVAEKLDRRLNSIRHRDGQSIATGALVWMAAICLQALVLPPGPYGRPADGQDLVELQSLEERVRGAQKPVIGDDMVIVLRAGREVVWEPAIFAELASTGAWSEAPFVRQILAGRFAFFITHGSRGDELFSQRYRPAVAAAIDAAYPHKEHLAGYVLHLPTTASE